MCDVDDRGRASPPSTRRASTTSPRCCTARASTPTSSAASACPSATSTGPTGTSCSTRCTTPSTRSTIALVGKYIDLPDAYLSVTEALRAGGFAPRRQGATSAGSPSDECETPAGAAAGARRASTRSACPAASACAASRASSARCAGPASNGVPTLGPLPRPAVHGHRVRPQRRRPRRARRSTRVRPRHPAPGHRDDGGAEGVSSTAPATSAARCASGSTRPTLAEGSIVAEVYGATDGRRAPPPPLRGQQRLPRPARGGRAACSPAPRPTATLVEFVELPARRAPVLRRDPGAPRVPVAPEPRAPAVRRAGRRGARAPARAAAGRGRAPAADAT